MQTEVDCRPDRKSNGMPRVDPAPLVDSKHGHEQQALDCLEAI